MQRLIGDLAAVLQNLRQDHRGQGMVEYALILVLVSVVAAVTLQLIGVNVSNFFQATADALAAVPLPIP